MLPPIVEFVVTVEPISLDLGVVVMAPSVGGRTVSAPSVIADNRVLLRAQKVIVVSRRNVLKREKPRQSFYISALETKHEVIVADEGYERRGVP